MAGEADLDVVDATLLRRLAPALAGDGAAEIVDARSDRLVGGDGQGLGVYRVSGTARPGGRATPWSAIVKVLPSAGDQPPGHWCYAEREVLAYRSGLVAALPAGLRGPRLLGVERDGSGRDHLWLEDLGDEHERWTVDDYAWAARRLGRFNGAYLTGTRLPADPWLSHDWLRGWLGETREAVAELQAHADHRLVRRVYPPDVADGIAAIWADQERLFGALDGLPQTLCHHDAFRRNLARRGDDLIGLDWAFLGPGPVGAELSPLISATLAFGEVDAGDRDALEERVVTAYLAGLGDRGWHAASDQIWLAYTATSALRYGPGTVRLVLPTLLDGARHARAAELLGMPFDAVLDLWATAIRAEVALHARARALLGRAR